MKTTVIPESDMNVETALSRAPETKGYPAITPEFLALLRHREFRWDAQGLFFPSDRENLPSFLVPWRMTKRGKTIWWVGDNATRCTCSPDDFDALLRGRALADGSVLARGRARRLHHSKGWAYLVPRDLDAVLVRQHLVTLTNNVLGYLAQLDALMKQPSGRERDRSTATLSNALELANDRARYFGLGVDHAADKKKPLRGGVG
jgi:hypothetical protein